MPERSPERVRNELIAGVVDALQRSASVSQPGSREMWRQLLSDELAQPVEPFAGDALRPWLFGVVRIAAGVGDGLACVARSLAYLEQQSSSVAALWPLVDEWEAVDFFNTDLRPLQPALLAVPPHGLLTLARRASRSRIQELPAWCQTAWQVFLRLAGTNAPEGELPPSMAFLALCADRLLEDGQPEAAEALRRWNRSAAREFDLHDALADWQQTGREEQSPSVLPAYIVIQFEPDRIDPERYYVSHWRQSDSEGWHPVPGETAHVRREELPGRVEALVREAEQRWADLRQPVILEFVLPWELLNEPVEWWPKESDSGRPTPLIMDYPVVLRSLERLQNTHWHRPWGNKWRQLRERPADSHPYWSKPGAQGAEYFFHLERELKEDQFAVCLILSRPPGDASGTGREEMLAGLRAGVPAMIWHRADCADAAFRDAVGEIVEERGLGSLLDRVGSWRRAALAAGPAGWDEHVGRHLAILFDDPDRKPGRPGQT